MIKKIVPIIALLGVSAFVVGQTPDNKTKFGEILSSNIDAFENEVDNYANNNSDLTATYMDRYEIQADLSGTNDLEQDSSNNEEAINDKVFNPSDEVTNTEEKKQDNLNDISTLYSLSTDIESSCNDFCELKTNITKAIAETQGLLNKIKENQIELSDEQRISLLEQAKQLKSLGRQLSNTTMELSLNLTDLNQIILNGNNINNLSLKYLLVLDNLINGNEMLVSGLSSLNLINQILNSSNLPPNTNGRILYGYQENNNPPIVKDYYLDNNGNLVENNSSNKIEENEMVDDVSKEDSANIDTYKSTNLSSNLDTYNNNNLPHNIDSFFNTALLDNKFMYGNGNYGYAGMNGYNYYPNNQYNNYSTNGGNSYNNTQYNDNKTSEDKSQKEKKRFKLEKNIDTFKDENTPDLKTKLGNIKNSISNLFKKFKISNFEDKVENPVYRFTPEDNN